MQLRHTIFSRMMYSLWLLWCWVLWSVSPLYAMPKEIKRIVKILECNTRKLNQLNLVPNLDSTVEKDDSTPESLDDPNEAQSDDNLENSIETDINAKAYKLCLLVKADIDQAIANEKLAKSPSTWYYRGVIYERLLRLKPFEKRSDVFLKQALEAYDRVQKITKPTHQFHSFAVAQLVKLWEFFFKKGIDYYQQESFEQALECLAICRRILSDEPTPILYLGMVYHAMQNYPLALEYYEAYLKRSAPQVAVYRAIAHIKHVHLNQVEQAIDVLDQALAKFPFDNTVLHDKFLIYECVDKLGSYTKTLWNVMLDGTALSHQNVIKNLYAYAYCLTYQNQIDQAMVYYQKILQKNPYQYQTLGQLGYIYYNKAIDSYKKYVELEQEQRVRDTTSALVIHGMHAHQKEVYPLNFQDYISQNPLISLKPKYIEPSVLGLTEDSVYLFRPTYIGIRTLGFLKLLTFHNIFYIANLYNGLQQDSSLWTYHTLCVYSMQLKQQLQEAVSYFQKVYKQNKQDKVLLKALYYSYYYLNKKNAASRMYRLVNQDLGKEDDPFED